MTLADSAVMRRCAPPAVSSTPCGKAWTADTSPNETQPSLASKTCLEKNRHTTNAIFRIFIPSDFLLFPSVLFRTLSGLKVWTAADTKVHKGRAETCSLFRNNAGLQFQGLITLCCPIDRLNDR